LGEGEKGGGRMHFIAFSEIEVRCMNVELTLQLKSCDKNSALKFQIIQKIKSKIFCCPQPAS
jgi:hypothetical protein